MAGLIKPLNNVYDQLRRLPGLGAKSALRLAYHVIDMDEADVARLAQTLIEAKKQIHLCKRCFNFTDQELCTICADTKRDQSLICVVEEPQDVLAMERTHCYKGVYHVLHGVIDPMSNIGPDDIYVPQLVKRVGNNPKIREIILATNPTMEGEATAMYIVQKLKTQSTNSPTDSPLILTRIGRGLPIGADLEYADETTIHRAMEGRREF